MDKEKPEFPIKVLFHEDGKSWVLNDESELACSLEWFDSGDSEEDATVTDSRGRAVTLVVKALQVEQLELAQ